ncbi:hypothetical protein [Gordonibacter pamelaeae]|uniref:hypothetical protein n=1 Tax=Gordonibacter pamelaeae TaxID=471189 RepID=UPI003AEF2279
MAAMAACACLCAALFGCAAKEPTAQEANQDRQAAVQPTPDAKEPERIEAPLREGKGEITVLVLNASGKGGRHAKLPRKSRRSASSTLRLVLITPILLRRSTCRCYTVPRLADTCRCGNR